MAMNWLMNGPTKPASSELVNSDRIRRMLFQFDTVSVSINAKPEKVYKFVSDLNNWKQFSDFGRDIEQVEVGKWIFHTSQGDVTVSTHFDKQKLLLDHTCILASGEEQFIPYRVVPNGDGSELIMTNFQGKTSSDEDYAEQLKWMKDELNNIKAILEK